MRPTLPGQPGVMVRGQGLVPAAGKGPVRPDPQRAAAFSPLTTVFPGEVKKHAYFAVVNYTVPIPSPAGTANSSWFILRRIRSGPPPPAPVPTPGITPTTVESYFPQFALTGVKYSMSPTNPDGNDYWSTGNTVKTWGDTRGGRAAIVIARDLPQQPQSWFSSPAFLPGVANTLGSQALINPAGAGSDYILPLFFPPGKINDTSPSRLTGNDRWLPDVHRFPTGSTLDVCLVLNAGTPAASGEIQGEALISLALMPLRQDNDFQQY